MNPTMLIVPIAFALGAIGILASSKLKLPSILFYLIIGIFAGLLFGSSALNLITETELNSIASMIIGPIVGLIIFEGAMALNIKKLRSTSKSVVNLILIGVPVTIVLIAVLAHFLFGLEWLPSILIGAILSVTGPTVITPLFKRVDVWPSIKKILSAEGILVDVVGAVISILVLEFILVHGSTSEIISQLIGRLFIGSAVGFVIGWLAVNVIKLAKLKETGPAVAITFAAALVAFAIPESISPESGIISAAVAGFVMGNMVYKERNACLEFKGEIVTLAISMVFVVLAATINPATFTEIGWLGAAFALGVILVVRPLMVFLSTLRVVISNKEKIYVALTGPRGIVAASVASLVAVELGKNNPDGSIIKALVFIVIIVSVTFVSFLAKPLARWLEVVPVKVLIVGANAIGIELAGILEKRGDSVILIDIDPTKVEQATKHGYEAILGDATSEDDLMNADAKETKHLIVVTSSDSKNLMIAQIAKSKFHIEDIVCMISRPERMEAFEDLGIKTMSPTISSAQTIESLIHHSSALCILGEGDCDVVADQVTIKNPEIFDKMLREINLPSGAIVALIRRAGSAHIPLGSFVLLKGDTATIFAQREQVDAVKRLLVG
jgi:NhaP-type Na+/H+ or K+/H+ antiporter/Trk K+ transport system NAD-binding subunit